MTVLLGCDLVVCFGVGVVSCFVGFMFVRLFRVDCLYCYYDVDLFTLFNSSDLEYRLFISVTISYIAYVVANCSVLVGVVCCL